MNKWAIMWEERGKSYPSMNPRELDGHSHPTSLYTQERVDIYIEQVKKALNLSKNNSLLEVGCGAGMLLGPLSQYVGEAVGVDIAKSMLKKAKIIFPYLKLCVAQANNLPFQDFSFDKVLCAGVFHYFPNLKYAKEAIIELKRVCKFKGKIMITFIPDKKMKKEYKRIHKKSIKKDKWISSFGINKLKWLFYDKDFFKDFFKNYKIENVNIPGYLEGKFKFNLVATND